MTEGSKFPNGVVVKQRNLTRTETTKADATKQRQIDLTSVRRAAGLTAVGGVVDGLRVSLNAVPTLIDVTAGSAFVPNGERATVTSDQAGMALSDYADGTRNWVVVFYTESAGVPQPHETDGTTRNTDCIAGFEVAVLTVTEFNALPATLADQTGRAQDRAVVVAQVLGNGTTSGSPNNLVAGEITQEAFEAEAIGVEYDSSVIPGVNLVEMPDVTSGFTGESTTAGQLSLDVTLPQFTKNLSYRAPNDTSGFGTAVNVASAEGLTTLTSGDGSSQITVDVSVSHLCDVVGTTTVDVTVTRYYEPIGSGYSAADRAHRNKNTTIGAAQLGDVAMTSTNPHSTTGRSLGHSFVRLTDPVVIGDDHLDTADEALRPRIRTRDRQVNGSITYTLVAEYGSPLRLNTRLYRVINTNVGGGPIDGRIEWVQNAFWDGAQYVRDRAGFDSARMLILGSGGFAIDVHSSSAADTWTSWEFRSLDVNDTNTSFPGAIDLGSSTLSSAALADTARIAMLYSGTHTRTKLFESSSDGVSSGTQMRMYRATATGDGLAHPFEIVMNALWSDAGNTWSADDTGVQSTKIEILRDGRIRAFARDGSAGIWADGDWDTGPNGTTLIDISQSLNQISTSHDFQTSSNYTYSPARTFIKSIPGIAGQMTPTAEFTLAANIDPEADIPRIVKSGGNQAWVYWPLELPNGATVTAAEIRTQNVAGTGELRVAIARTSTTAFNNAETFKAPTPSYDLIANAGNTAISVDRVSPAGITTIDNDAFGYFVWLSIAATRTIDINNIQVSYSMTVLEP